ncbi:DUF2273 domain-containing protein [Alicyclobacillus tolerans]|uniref:DUF2273 domain-containing protein n=1 Tax=Alicyclobacillus tolerans TaxID=90970 RepID=UPI001F27CE2B|nr:DUF2273 domain-containing protein [Alicyclobacillus tolerans]MCF8563595.1 DUF2273 domain-containing protein [Alicyclobacillus tolerans]
MKFFLTWIHQILSLKRRWLGLIVGCLLWLAWMLFGLWATVLLLVFAAVGYAVGRVLEEHQSWKDIVEKLLSEKFGD